MKSALLLVLSPLFLIGVFGDEVSVMEGDSVTLQSGVTEIQKDDGIQWRLNGARIAKISSGSKGISVLIDPNGAFGDRLKLDDKTGDLKITDIKTTDAGEYKLEITSTRGSSEKTFRVTVVASADGDAVSVQVRDSVTLHAKIQRDDVIQWRFGPQHSLVAEISRPAGIVSTHDGPDGRFKDRLKLDYWTGSLTIRNIGENHAGVYEVDISSSGYTIHKTFNVTVSAVPGLSSGAIVGIVVVILMAVAVAVAAAGVIYHRHWINELERKWLRMLSVIEGESVPLIPLFHGIKIHKDDDIQWKFRDAPIAERKGVNGEITVHDDVHDGIFKGRLELDEVTRSLTITDITSDMSGRYELWISRPGHESFMKTFTVSVFAKPDMIEIEIVKKGDPVTLSSGVTEIQGDDQIQWKFERKDPPIAQIKGGTTETFPSAAGGIFRGRLKLDQNGSLTIEKIRPKDAGLYHLYITKSGKSMKSFMVDVRNPNDDLGMRLMGIS